jgi:hypothetical protein
LHASFAEAARAVLISSTAITIPMPDIRRIIAEGGHVAKAKGTVLIGLVKALRRNKEKARELLPAKLLHYLESASSSPPGTRRRLRRPAPRVGKIAEPERRHLHRDGSPLRARPHGSTYSRLKKA